MIEPTVPGDSQPGPDVAGQRHPRRLLYLDNLRIALITGVIAAHATTAYIGGGAWTKNGSSSSVVFTAIGAAGLLGTTFWLGLFFLISGLLAPASLTHHGVRHFLRDRLLRLGVPFVVYVGVVMPTLDYTRYVVSFEARGQPTSPGPWLVHYAADPDPGPMWFVADLLLLSVGYAAWWCVRPRGGTVTGPLRLSYLAGLATAITVSSFAVHLIWPIASRQFLDLHVWQGPQYVLLFWLGIVSARAGWLEPLPNRIWHLCGWAVAAVVLAIPGIVVAGGALSGDLAPFAGGWHWQALAMAAVEGVLAVAGSLWVLDFFRRYISSQGPIIRQLGRSAYGAFVVHTPILTGIILLLRLVSTTVEFKILILALSTVVLSYALAWLFVVRLRMGGSIL